MPGDSTLRSHRSAPKSASTKKVAKIKTPDYVQIPIPDEPKKPEIVEDESENIFIEQQRQKINKKEM